MINSERLLRVLVVDDEEPARSLLREYLEGVEGVELVGECANGFEAVKAVSERGPDLLLLDIQMPKLTGFEVLELIGEPAPAVVFVTAYDEYAIRAFEVHAVDYLLKPFERRRLHEALERARERRWQAQRHELPVAELARAARPDRCELERILVREGPQVHVIPVDQVDYIEAADDTVQIHHGGAHHSKPVRLSDLARRLDPGRFARIHRSFVVNVDRLARIERYAKDSRVAILRNGVRLPVSRAGYARLRELL